MSTTAKAGLWIGGFFLIILAWWAWGAFQADRQLENRFRGLVEAVEDRNWKKLETYLADDYVDEWGNNRARTLELAQQGFQYFLVLEITPVDPEFTLQGREAEVRTKFDLVGRGRGPAQIVLKEAGKLQEPFVLVWRQESWKPWDWRLISMSQPELKLGRKIRAYGL